MDPLVGLVQDARVQVRRRGDPNPAGRCVVYWMQRSQRAVDNPALNVAIEAANALRKPVIVLIALVPFYPNSSLRSCAFFAQGLPDIRDGLEKRNIGLVVCRWPDHELQQFCEQVNPCLVIGDENPMREPEALRKVAAEHLRVPFWTVDSDVIVPSALLKKEQFAARTIRPRIHALLGEFLVPLENPKAKIPWIQNAGLGSFQLGAGAVSCFPTDFSVQPVAAIPGGTGAALGALRRFVKKRLASYERQRNQPDIDGTSQLSPYLRFGHIGPHTVALAVKNADAPREDREAFLDQLIVRRELSINFVRFNPNYDNLKGAEPWALRTHQEHRRDEREYLYSERQLENAETHDPLWNASQQQMVAGGWMHGYLRMYWAKKISEWTRTPEEAFAIAVRLNDKYELDGRDPNGYTGIAWAIGGKHDRAWGPERPIYGKIRYMSHASTSRKFNSKGYIERVNNMLKGPGSR
jgi:deoxyribodipyrimidine photo-lyase